MARSDRRAFRLRRNPRSTALRGAAPTAAAAAAATTKLTTTAPQATGTGGLLL